MKGKMLFVLCSTLSIMLIFVARSSYSIQKPHLSPKLYLDAAFGDGLFQGQLDAASGRDDHIMSARWNSSVDRTLFIAGYRQGYARGQAGVRSSKSMSAAELAGYHDGLVNGKSQRNALREFEAKRATRFGGTRSEAPDNHSDEAYERDYRLGYWNGYQEGYYLPSDDAISQDRH